MIATLIIKSTLTQGSTNFTFYLEPYFSFPPLHFLSFSSRPGHYLPKAQISNLVAIICKILSNLKRQITRNSMSWLCQAQTSQCLENHQCPFKYKHNIVVLCEVSKRQFYKYDRGLFCFDVE